MELQRLYEKFMSGPKVMQLATVDESGKPWICTVYFVKDSDGTIYWHSAKNRAHSKHILDNPNVAATIVYDEDKKRAAQVSGEAEVVGVEDVIDLTRIHDLYTAKIGGSSTRLQETLEDKPEGRAYWRLNTETIHIWDEVEFPDNPKQVVS